MFKKLFLILFLIIFSTQLSYSAPDAKKIMENLYMADSLGKIQDMMIELELFGPAPGKQEAKNVMQSFATAKLFFSTPNKIRTEKTIIMAGTQMDIFVITIRDGRLDWQYSTYSSWPLKKKEDDHHHSPYLPFSIDVQPQDQFRNYTVVNQEKIGDRNAYVISIANEKDPQAKLLTVWVDTERYIPLKEEYTVVEGEGDKAREVTKTTMYKDAKQVNDNRWIPHKIERYSDGKMNAYIVYKQAAVNVGIPESLFAPEDPTMLEKGK
jgi:outer membrane lipoprotein-sorting protein